MEGPPVPKAKTKAKERYLKRKKERRKVNKSKNKKTVAAAARSQARDVGEEDGEREEEEEEIHEEVEEGEEEEEIQEEIVIEKRPKKRRKLSIEPEAARTKHTKRTKHTDPIQNSPPPIPQTALPIFPLPTHPSAPSNLKTTLALQGLDRALVDAEVVPPGRTMAVKIGSDKDRWKFLFGFGSDSIEEWTKTGLSEKMSRRLVELGITELFAVQTCLLPFLLPRNATQRALYQPYNPPRDVCVCAPTGSGKTLAYAIPIVEILSTRITTRLRALIVLPTRDLVMQVRETFEEISKGRGLKIGTATGQHSFTHEQGQLVEDIPYSLLGGCSKLDILISTPGRLIDHLNDTPNFTLQHLRFLVIDEADRLLAQSFQDWLGSVVGALRPPSHVFDGFGSSNLIPIPDALSPAFHHLLPLHHHHHPNFLYPDPTAFSSFPTEHKHASCQKLLFSATLTRDPGKIAALELRDPKYFVVQGGPAARGIDEEDKEEDVILDVVSERFTMPATLKEHMIICTTYNKPLVFFHLVHTRLKTLVQSQSQSQKIQTQNSFNALVFTKSAESTNRLVRLFEFFQVAREKESKEDTGMDTMDTTVIARAYSSDLPPSERKSILEEFKAGKIQILISSDLISRGIDLPNITHVISYDSPVDIRKYVHRLGRTARAGRDGQGWTLVEEQEARHFKLMLKTANHLSHVKRVRIGEREEKELEGLVKSYETALGNLKEVYAHSHSRS
ncbi:DEAD-domain-containing protein [Lentinula raphanica]|nr:DEAD-domain-containing protein [Lentinula raphanica]